MKLAEALQLRADLQCSIQQLESRINSNVTVQEGETPAEDPQTLIAQLKKSFDQLEQLMSSINKTNCETRTEKGTLTELIARRDCLKMRLGAYRSFLSEASSITRRATHSEIKIISTISVADYQKQVDRLSKELREVDTLIQSTNWSTELL